MEGREFSELQHLGDNRSEVVEAKKKELMRMAEFGLFQVVDKETVVGKHFQTTKWVVVRKPDGAVRAR